MCLITTILYLYAVHGGFDSVKYQCLVLAELRVARFLTQNEKACGAGLFMVSRVSGGESVILGHDMRR